MINRFFRARRAYLHAACAIALGLALPSYANPADSYPDKPVSIVVGFAPGGTNDILARMLATKLQQRLDQSFVVDNRPGANSAIGNGHVAKAKADGYTLLVSSSGGLTANPVLMKNLPYDPVNDFEPIALLGTFPLVVTVPASLPATTFNDLIELSKTNSVDGKLDHGTPTTSFVLVAETLTALSDVKFNHILYKGSGPVVAALLGGEIQVAVLDSAAVVNQIKAGKLKALAVTTAERSRVLPDVPTVAESGYPGYEAPIWTALLAPKGTPEPVLAKLRSTIAEILQEPDTIEKMQVLGMSPGDVDSSALSKRITSDISRWEATAIAADLKPK